MNADQIRRLVAENIELFDLCKRAISRFKKGGGDWPGDRALLLDWEKILARRWENYELASQNTTSDPVQKNHKKSNTGI